MDLQKLTLFMRVLADENLLAIITENVDDPHTLFHLVFVLPTAKTIFGHYPRRLLTATLGALPSELEQLAILYVALIQHHPARASKISILKSYLRLNDTLGYEVTHAAAADLTILKNLSDPFETLRRLADVWIAVEGLASGFVEQSIQFIEMCKGAQAESLGKTKHYNHSPKFRPLHRLWDRVVHPQVVPGSQPEIEPQPWSLPLRASEVYRVKRALWRHEIFAALSHEPHTFPNESATGFGAGESSRPNNIENWAMPRDYDKGTRLLLASLQGFELAELDSVYDYLWRETIEKVYHHNDMGQQSQTDRIARDILLHDVEQWEQDAEWMAQVAMRSSREMAHHMLGRHLTYCTSIGLHFLHRVHQQVMRDNGKIVLSHYPPLPHRYSIRLRGTCTNMDSSRSEDVWSSYRLGLLHIETGNFQIIRRAPEDSPGASAPNVCAVYLGRLISVDYCVKEVWRAGCYMWEGGR